MTDRYKSAMAEIENVIQRKLEYARTTENKRAAFANQNEAKILSNACSNIEDHVQALKQHYETRISKLQDKDDERANRMASLTIQMFKNLSRRTTKNKIDGQG